MRSRRLVVSVLSVALLGGGTLGVLPACGSDATVATTSDVDAGRGDVDGTPDGGAQDDGGGPAGPPPTADGGADGGTGFCAALAPPARFCDDFDDGDGDDGWQVTTAAPANLTVLELELDGTSAPYALRAGTRGLAASQQANASLRTTLSGALTRATLAFSVKISTTDVGTGSIALATLDVASNHFFTLFLRDDDPDSPGPSLEETSVGGTVKRRLARAPTPGAWTRVVVDVDLGAGTADVTYDGAKVLDAAPVVATPGTEATIRLGTVYVLGPTNPFDALFDDVVLR